MKILVISTMLKDHHRERILEIARKYDARVCFVGSEGEVPEEFAEPGVVYGFGIQIAKTQKSLKWLCVPSAGAFVVNVGRGSAIDEEALADCLEAGHLAGAALDVFPGV